METFKFFPHFSKQNKFQAKTMFTTGKIVRLAEWIIDDTHVLFLIRLLLVHAQT